MRILESRYLLAASGLALLGGCASTNFSDDRVGAARSAEELGSVGLGVISVSRWQDVAGELEAKFPTDEKTVLAEAIPTTSTVTDRIVDIMIARLGISYAGTSINASETDKSKTETKAESDTDKDGVVTDISSRDESSSSDESETRTRTTPSAPAVPDVTAGGAATLGTPPARVTGVDAFTRYTAANALKQELVVLNRYVRDAAQRTGYEPFLVRLQFGVQPRRRDQPFDTTMRVSFLPGDQPVESLAVAASDNARAGGSTFSALFKTDLPQPAQGDWNAPAPTTTITGYSAFHNLFAKELAGEARLTGFTEEGAFYKLTVTNGGQAKTHSILKPCFFKHMPRYLNSIGVTSKRAYGDFAASARFAPAFFEQVALEEKALDKVCPAEAVDGQQPPAKDPFDEWRTLYRTNLTRLPVVVPLVVTDNLEGTREYQAAQQLRQAALALSAFGGPVGGSANFGRTLDRIREYEATRLNSIYSVARLTENTIQVRMGASRLGDRYEMVPRTVQSTVLLLVPREQTGHIVELVARPSYDNAETGRTLRLTGGQIDDGEYVFNTRVIDRASANRICGGRRLDKTSLGKCQSRLTNLSASTVHPDGWTQFVKALQDVKANKEPAICYGNGKVDTVCAADLWAELQREQQRIRTMSRARAEIPGLRPRDLPPLQTASAKLSGTSDQITIVGIDPWLKPGIRARAGLDCSKKNADGSYAGFMATKLDVNGDVGTFAVPRPAGDDSVKPTTICLWLENSGYSALSLGMVDGSSPSTPRVYPVSFVKEEKKDEKEGKPPFEIAVSDQTVVTSSNKGTVKFEIRNFDSTQIDRILFTAEDGVIADAGGVATLDTAAYRAIAKGKGPVQLRVESINTEDRKVRIIATGMMGEESKKVLQVDVRLREGKDES